MSGVERFSYQRFLLVVFAYAVAGKLGLMAPYFGSHITLFWLPTGIAAAALLRWGLGMLPAIYLGALLANLMTQAPLPMAAAIAVGNTLAPLLVRQVLQRLHFHPVIDRPQDVLTLLLATAIGMSVSASGGVLTLLAAGDLSPHSFIKAWLAWWAGDAVGVLLAMPLLINTTPMEVKRLWVLRGGFLPWFVSVMLLEWIVFQLVDFPAQQFMLLAFLIMPLVIWSALRFGLVGTLIAVVALAGIAAGATASARGPFYLEADENGMFSLWLFMATMALLVLMINMLQAGRERSERNLRDSEAQLRAVIDGALDGVVTIDSDGRLIEFNPAAERIFGYRREDVIGKPMAEYMIPPALREAHYHGHGHFLQTGEKNLFDQRMEMTAMRADGTTFPVELTITSLYDKGLPLVTGFLRDITKRKQAEQEIRNLAAFDALTGLPNRRLLIDQLKQALSASQRSLMIGAVLFVDLDHFKAINDTRGHDTGDALLIEVAKRLKQTVRAQDVVARLGGDEFVIVLEEVSVDRDYAVLAVRTTVEKILAEINQPCWLGGQEYHHSASIGVALFGSGDVSVEELLKRADTAMYQAKSAGRNTMRFFDPEMQATLERRTTLEAQLRTALQQNQFVLHYQVQVDATGRIFGAEALIRWQHPERGSISPVEFIPVAEDSGLIVPIGRWVLRSACLQLRQWAEALPQAGIQLAVNVSARQFRQQDFVADVKALLIETGVDPALLKLELTESTVLDNLEDAVTKMHELRALGVHFSMDDFGTGYSSLAYLKQFPLEQVKIDRSFVRDVAFDLNDAAIVKAIISISSSLRLNVIAEGVETREQFDFLKESGCRQFQGYLFSKPLPADEAARLIQENRLSLVGDSGENSVLAEPEHLVQKDER